MMLCSYVQNKCYILIIGLQDIALLALDGNIMVYPEF